MKSYREGDWFVTTPIYAGSAEQVEGMAVCDHKWKQDGDPVAQQDQEMVMETCHCGARRAKHRPSS